MKNYSYLCCRKSKHNTAMSLTTLTIGLARAYAEKFPLTEGEELLVVSKKVFGDEEEHEINFHYGDGFAISEDFSVAMTYPKRSELTKEDREAIRDYDGIPAPRAYTYRDICLYFGEPHTFLKK